MKFNLTDTIAAISTPVGASGIGIVRISGKDALKIADRVFLSKDGKRAPTFKTYTMHYGWVVAGLIRQGTRRRKGNLKGKGRKTGGVRGDVVDEVILTVMRAPKSYTREDIIEINCHGGIVALRRVLDLVLENGCRLAEPGEFTKRAFLKGRIDLPQAEAVLDIIRAKTDAALKVGTQQLKGSLSGRINTIREMLLDALSVLDVNIDFPEEDLGEFNLKQIRQNLCKISDEFKEILDNAKSGRILREGIHVVICGKPNVGKSSLLNALLEHERSIVTSVAGTTRDTIEEIIDINGIPVRIVDTAGIIEPRDLVEKKAVIRSNKQIELADLAILVFDGSRRLTPEDTVLMRKLKKKITIAVINKIDLRQKIERDKIPDRLKGPIGISAKRQKNIKSLENAITELVYAGKTVSSDAVVVGNLRHIAAIRQAQKFIAQTLDSLDNKLTLELIAQDIKDALGCLDEVLGRRFSEELLNKIFSEFCIGK